MLGPALQNLGFLCQKCWALTAKQRCGSLDAAAKGGNDGFEEVFYFIAVRIALDFINLVDHLGILHLPQQLRYLAVAVKEACFGGVGLKVQIDFLQWIRLPE
ncbi:unnamed protein product [Schistocephalus solidus]|uniref:Secreted protein n=1 Tax=Schistocephalus solidus TaxID=70667 RepID=A0A183T406_SCHSO|nr:unnamed protein product [Schistocephalus solidus]